MASNPEQPQFAQVFVKSEPPEEELSATTSATTTYETVVKEELIIEQDQADKDREDDEAFKSIRIKYLPDGVSIECHECGKIIPDYKSYVQHIRRHRNIRLRRFQCKPCNKIFSDKGDLLRHNGRFHESKTEGNQEESAGKQAIKKEDKPEARVLEENGIFKCSECNKTFRKRGIADAHVEMHENLRKELFKCPTCGKCFACKSALGPHERAHQVMQAAAPPPSERAKSPIEVMRHDAVAFKCAECGYVFDKRKSYFKHARRHKIIKRGDYQCPICGMYLAAQSELDKHLETHRTDSETKPSRTPLTKADKAVENLGLICETCDKLLPNYISLKRHTQRHVDIEKGTYRCNQCGQYFSTKHGLNSHLKKNGHSQDIAGVEEGSGSNRERSSSEEMNLSDTQQPVSKPKKPKLVLKKIVIKKADE